jgi:hypothetical protein
LRRWNSKLYIEEKQLQLSDHIKGIDWTRISRKAFKLKFKGKKPVG